MKKNAISAWSQKPLKPSPAVQKLGYFVGAWTTTGVIAEGPWGTGGKFRWRERTKWMSGNFFLVGYWNFQMPSALGGDGEEIFILGYDPQRKLYTFDAFSSQGLHQLSRGKLRGDTWIWSSEAPNTPRAPQKKIQQKMTVKILSPKRYRLKFELSMNGGKWIKFMEGTAEKK